MPRSSFSEKPLLRVSRPVSACIRCRTAKVKCDGKLPACTACEKAGRAEECSAANDQFARGKERSYVAALELRVEKLERRLAYARERKASVAQHEHEAPPDSTSASDRRGSLANIRAAIHRKAAREIEESDMNSLLSDFGYLSVNGMPSGSEPSATAASMSFGRLVLAASMDQPLPDFNPAAHHLASREVALATLQHYMANIYPLYPAFSETTLLSLFNDLYSDGQHPTTSADAWLLWMVLAIGSLSQSQRHNDQFYMDGVQYGSRALPYAERALDTSKKSLVQSLLLLTQYAMLDPIHFDSWVLIGLTSRAVIDLGLHQQDAPNAVAAADNGNGGAQEARRMLFYCIYALDRAISMVHARPFSFTDDAKSAMLPQPSSVPLNLAREGAVLGPPAPSCALPLFRLRSLQSRWYQQLFHSDPSTALPDAADPTSFVWQMCHEMRDWAASLPPSLPTGIREMLELELRYSYVYCMSPNPRTPNLTSYGRLLIFEHALVYLDRIYEVAHAPSNSAFYTYHDALRVFFMGSQFVAVLRADADILLGAELPPIPLTAPGNYPPLPLPDRFDHATSGDNLDRSLRSLQRASLTLKKLAERWEITMALKDSFDMMASGVLENLKQRKGQRDAARGAAGTVGISPVGQIPIPMSAQQQQQQQQHMVTQHMAQPQLLQHPVLMPPPQMQQQYHYGS